MSSEISGYREFFIKKNTMKHLKNFNEEISKKILKKTSNYIESYVEYVRENNFSIDMIFILNKDLI